MWIPANECVAAQYWIGVERRLPDWVWPGVTVENQDNVWRIGELLKIPAAKHWASLEPLLSQINFKEQKPPCSHKGCYHHVSHPCEGCGRVQGFIPLHLLGGIVVGGESGPGARPMYPDWARGIRDDCVEAGVPYTLKQWGEWAPEEAISENDRIVAGANDRWGTVDLDGRLWELTTPWTSIDLQTGETTKDPEEVVMWRVGKKAAGRELDGQVWDQWPWDVIGREK